MLEREELAKAARSWNSAFGWNNFPEAKHGKT
jgi:hypothetical protein